MRQDNAHYAQSSSIQDRPLTKAEQELLQRTDLRLLTCKMVVKIIKNIRTDEIRAGAGPANISEKSRGPPLRW